MRRFFFLILFLSLFAASSPGYAQQRFPPPDFESGYEQPVLTFQEYSTGAWQYIDVVVLIAALGLTSWLLHWKRWRSAIFVTGIVCLLYFGFFKNGCVCSIGAIQNVSLGIADHTVPISIPILAFFLLPLLVALFYGRIFCGAVCPLGAIQDVMIHRPVRVPAWLERAGSLLRYVYLGLAVFFVFEFRRFIICEYDPFVSMFRLNGPGWRFALGGGLLLVGLFVARPYCRYLCPLGALLSVFSRWPGRRVTVTPRECINCTLCDDACPFGAIKRPERSSSASPALRFLLIGGATVLIIGLGAGGWFALGGSLSGALLGAWLGVVVGGGMLSLIHSPGRDKYEVDQAACLSCGRCYEWCPHEQERLKTLEAKNG